MEPIYVYLKLKKRCAFSIGSGYVAEKMCSFITNRSFSASAAMGWKGICTHLPYISSRR